MTNNYENEEHNDGFGEPDIEHTEKPRGVGGNLAEAWRTRPLFKFMVLIIAVFAVAVAGFSFFGGKDASNDITHLSRPPNLHEAPGGPESPYMVDQTKKANQERSDQAIATGGSAIPTPIGAPTDVGNFGANPNKEDPLTELRAEVSRLRDEQAQSKAQVQVLETQKAQAAPEPFDDSLAQAMQQQMKQLMEGWTPRGMKQVEVIKAEDLKKMQDQEASQAAQAANAAAQSAPVEPPKPVVNAGTVSYAQLLTEANSDVPGPILAQLVSGPLAGARLIGQFKVGDGYEKYLVLEFSLADKQGKDYQINAIALDPNTTLGGMATEVDERYFVRVVLPAAAGFLQGMGQALGQGNSSITTNGTTTIATTTGNGFKQGVYTGMGDAANTAGEFFQNQANLTKPLVRVASGTPMGIFFITPVYDPAVTSGTANVTQPVGNPGYGNGYGYGAPNGGVGNPGYPGTTLPGYGGALGYGTPGYGVQQNISNGAPYPNYAIPNAGYNGLGGGATLINNSLNNPAVQQNISNNLPYPNYNAPNAGYNNLGSSLTHN